MNFSRRRAISPIIASLLLIAIAVAAGIIVYVYVNSLAGGLTSGGGNQVSQQTQLQAYAFNIVCGATSCGAAHAADGTGQVIDIFLKNVGTTSVAISSVYLDGSALTEWGVSSGAYNQYLMTPNSAQSCFAALPASETFTISNSQNSGTASGAANSCTPNGTSLASTACTDTNFCLSLSPSPYTETLTLAPQGANQLVIGLNAAVTPGTSHTIKIVTSSGGQTVITVVAGRTG